MISSHSQKEQKLGEDHHHMQCNVHYANEESS